MHVVRGWNNMEERERERERGKKPRPLWVGVRAIWVAEISSGKRVAGQLARSSRGGRQLQHRRAAFIISSSAS